MRKRSGGMSSEKDVGPSSLHVRPSLERHTVRGSKPWANALIQSSVAKQRHGAGCGPRDLERCDFAITDDQHSLIEQFIGFCHPGKNGEIGPTSAWTTRPESASPPAGNPPPTDHPNRGRPRPSGPGLRSELGPYGGSSRPPAV